MTEDFYAAIAKEESRIKDIAQKAVEYAKSLGVDEAEATIGLQKGLSVSTRKADVENIEFNKNRGLDITVFKNKKRGNASTTDFSADAIKSCVEAAVNLASFTDADPCAGIADKEDLCTEEKDLKLVYPLTEDVDKVLALALETEKIVLKDKIKGIKDSDGAGCETSLVIKAIANSHGFVGTKARTFNYLGLTLLGDDGIKMQRGSGYSTSLDFAKLKDPQIVAKEAVDRTLEKLNAKKIATGIYNVIFSKGAMMSLWGHLLSAISGGAVYRKTTFLHESLNEAVLPEFITLHEDPFITGGLASGNFDGEGVQARVGDIVAKGVLKEFLLSSYTARKLNLKTNGHSGSVYNLCVVSDKDPVSLDAMMKDAGSGIVITDLMGQGVDLLTGNYSRGAAGFYFENGERKHAVEEITVAGNLKDMFKNIALVGNDYDDRFKIKSGSLLIPDMTISGI